MKPFPLFAALVLAVACVATALTAPAAQSAAPTATEGEPLLWAARASTHVFPDSLPDDTGGTSALALDSARNEFEAGQVVVRWDREFTIKKVSFGSLTAGRHTIAASNLSYNFVRFTSLNHNSVFDKNGSAQIVYAPSRPAPDEFPDGLSNTPSIKVGADRTQPIWVRVKVPRDAAGGVYRGTVTLETDRGNLSLPLSINVRPVTIPDAKDSGFTDVEWTLFFGTVSYQEPPVETMLANYGFSPFSPEWWKLMEDYARIRKDYRNNNLTLPMSTLLMQGENTKVDPDGTVHFDWSRVDEVVEFFTERGTVSRLEGLWMAGGPGYWEKWDVETLATGPDGKLIKKYVDWDSAEADQYITQYVGALRDHVKAKGWDDRWWMHVGDEPQGTVGKAGWVGTYEKVKAVWPEVKIGDATFHEGVASEVSAYEDIVIPNLLNYETHPAAWDKARADGKDLWLYNCNIPTRGFLNRFVDQPQYYQRLIGWLAAARGANGHLHWAFNNWNISMDDQEVKGDFWTVNVDKEHKDLLERTLRLESLRDGIEDWEVVELLKQKHPGLATDLAKALASKPGTFTGDVTYLERIRALVLDAAAGKPLAGRNLAKLIKTGAAADLGAQHQVDGVFVTWGDSHPDAYTIQTSYDGKSWVDAGTRTGSKGGGEEFVGLNARARYVRLKAAAPGLVEFKIAGAPVGRPNLVGGLTYHKSWEPPKDFADDSLLESTDGVVSDNFGDKRPYVIQGGPGEEKAFNVIFDFDTPKQVREVDVQGYVEYSYYRPDSVRVLTSTDGETWTDRGGLTRPNDPSGNRYLVRFAPVDARHVKIAFTRTFTARDNGVFIDEIEIY